MYSGAPVPAQAADSRDRYVDFLRVFAIVSVVFGHWLMAVPHLDNGGFSATNALSAVSGMWILTWIFQVMPLFFFVGGFSNAVSLDSLKRKEGGYADYLLRRTQRLLQPVLVVLITWTVATLGFATLGVDGTTLHRVTMWITQPMWFIGTYILVVALAPVMLKLHRRFGIAVPMMMLVTATLVDFVRFSHGVDAIGIVNLVVVWAFAQQLGFFYADGSLIRL